MDSQTKIPLINPHQPEALKDKLPNLAEMLEIMHACIPVVGSFVLDTLHPLISIAFLKDPTLVAAMGIGYMWINCTANAFFFSFASGFEALVSQANGCQNYKLCYLYYQKANLCIFYSFILVILLVLCSDSLMIFFGFEPELVDLAYQYLKYTCLSSLFYGLLEIFRNYLHAQNIFSATLFGSFVALPLHILYCYLMVNAWPGSEIAAVGFALCLTLGSNYLLTYGYMKYQKLSSKTFFAFDIKAAKADLYPFFMQAFKPGIILYIEWLCFEAYTIQAGHLQGANQIAVHVVLHNISNTYYQFGESMGIVLTSKIGNALGNGNKIAGI